MTTKVTVEAHCAHTHQVVIERFSETGVASKTVLQDREKWEGVIYGNNGVNIFEVRKPT